MRGLSQGFPYARFNFLGLFLRRAGLFLLKAGLLRTVPVQGWSPQGCFPQGLSCPGLAFLRTSLKAVPELLCSGLLSQSLFCSGLLSSEPVLFRAALSGPVLFRAALLRACPVQGCSPQVLPCSGAALLRACPVQGLLSSEPVLFRCCSPQGLSCSGAALLRACPVQGCTPQGLSCSGAALLRACPVQGLLSSEPVLFKAWLFFSHLIVEFRQHLRQQIKHQIEYLGRQNGAFDKDVCHRSSRMYQQC